jgi:hypothetical protein
VVRVGGSVAVEVVKRLGQFGEVEGEPVGKVTAGPEAIDQSINLMDHVGRLDAGIKISTVLFYRKKQ